MISFKILRKCLYSRQLKKNFKILSFTLINCSVKKRLTCTDVSKLSLLKALGHRLHSMLTASKSFPQDIKFYKIFLKAYLLIKISKAILSKSFKTQLQLMRSKTSILIGIMIRKFMKKQKKNIGIWLKIRLEPV